MFFPGVQQTRMTENYVYIQDYEPDVICCQYSHLVCASRIKLVQVPLKKNLKNKNGNYPNMTMNK